MVVSDKQAPNGMRRRAMFKALTGATAATAVRRVARAAASVTVKMGYIRWMERIPTISLLDTSARNNGLAGAEVGLSDNDTTGQFLGQKYTLTDMPVQSQDDVVAKFGTLLAQGVKLILTDAPAADVLKLSAAANGKDAVIFNVQAPDDALRQEDCRANVIHVAPSRAMLADALGEYLVWKKWTRWLLAYGKHPNDALLRDAYRRSAKRYGARIVAERQYEARTGSPETDTGLLDLQKQMPVFTQNAPNYDVLVAADENQAFAGYLPYRTWDPRPVAGSAGLMPVSWDPNSVSFGGKQIQDRFNAQFHRLMTPLDMQAWTAVRMIGEAVSRTSSTDVGKIMAYMKGPDFQIGAYKGQALTLRSWDLQVRQGILLADGRNVVSISPQPGFLHQVNDLDTLGIDRPETKCKLT
jgi:ABC transporter substrate binding protein (PQQ-dependent alcohol dehydrogenase system)